MITLGPGEFSFGEAGTTLQTLLGSCVAITFWHPARKVGAMCHYLLPSRPSQGEGHAGEGYYGREVLSLILDRFEAMGIGGGELEVRLFGGGNMFPSLPIGKKSLIGELNLEEGRAFFESLGIAICEEDPGGETAQKITFEVETGRIQVERRSTIGPTQGGTR